MRAQCRQGLTLLEIVIALFLFAIAGAGVFQMLNTALDTNYRATQDIRATNLARGLIAEIMSKRFAENDTDYDIGPDGAQEVTGGRRFYDDVDDYDGLSESPPETINGSVMNGIGSTPNYSDFSRKAEVVFLDTNLEYSPTYTEHKRVTVTVTAPHVREVGITAIKTKLTE